MVQTAKPYGLRSYSRNAQFACGATKNWISARAEMAFEALQPPPVKAQL